MDQQTEQLQSMEDLIEIRSKDKEEYKVCFSSFFDNNN